MTLRLSAQRAYQGRIKAGLRAVGLHTRFFDWGEDTLAVHWINPFGLPVSPEPGPSDTTETVTGREQRSSHTERVAHLKGRVEATRTIYVREIERLSNEIRATTALPDPTSDNVRRKLSDLQSRVSHLSEAFKQDMTPLNVELAQLQKEQDTQ
jgi:hypothetical protein